MPLAICGVSEVPAFAAYPINHIVSFREVQQPGPDIRGFQYPYTLHSFVFKDTGSADDPLAVTESMIRRLLAIYAGTVPTDNVLFHCFAGVSRSSAAAFLWLVHHGMPYAEAYATVVAARGPFVAPNQLMVRLADGVMNRGGEMAAFLSAELGRRAPERDAWFEAHGGR